MRANYVAVRGIRILAVVAAIVTACWLGFYGYYCIFERTEYENRILFRDIAMECNHRSRSFNMNDQFTPTMDAHDLLAQLDQGERVRDRVKNAIKQGRNLYGNAYYVIRDDDGYWYLCDPGDNRKNDEKYIGKASVFSESHWQMLAHQEPWMTAEHMVYDPIVVARINSALAKYLPPTTAPTTQSFSSEKPREIKAFLP